MTTFSADDLGRHTAALRALAGDLLRDSALADDVVQQAHVAALESAPADPRALGAWLRTVVRRCALDTWRTERRRRARERLAAAGSEVVEPRDAAELLEVQQHVVAAVRALDEPYRTTVWQRYFEDRSPTAIAAAAGVPVKTVKTRLWRALQLLRQRLDARHGGRARWATAVLPLAPAVDVATSTAATTAAGATLMHGKTVVPAIVVVLVAAGAWWVARGGSEPAAPPATTAAAPAGAPALAVRTPTPPSDRPADEPSPREAVPAADLGPPEPFGVLLVRVHWHDGTPAADVAIDAAGNVEPQRERAAFRIVTDASGVARAPRVAPGAVVLTSDRGGSTSLDVRIGGVHEVVFQLDRGVDVSGTVVDATGRPVPAAEVVLVSSRGTWLGGRVLATTGTNGTFALRALAPTSSLAARAAHHAPSAVVGLATLGAEEGQPLHVELALPGPGAAVAGRVVDDTGAAVGDAVVVLGRAPNGSFDGERRHDTWSPRVAASGVDGTFRFDGIEPGEHPIAARTDGGTHATATVTCAGGTTTPVTLTLTRDAIVRGTVRDDTGAPVAGAHVATLPEPEIEFSLESVLAGRRDPGRARTRTDDAGAFELRGVPAGTVHVLAAVRTGFGQYPALAQASLAVRGGDVIGWDPVLRRGKTLRVRVVDDAGEPVHAGHAIRAIAEAPAGAAGELMTLAMQPPWIAEFEGCADVPYTVATEVFRDGRPGWAFVAGVRPGGEDAVLRLPPPRRIEPATVRGRVVDRSGRTASGSMRVALSAAGTLQDAQLDGGRFTLTGVPPGRTIVSVREGSTPRLVLDPIELRPGQDLDVGDVVIPPPARVRVAVRPPGGGTVARPAAVLGSTFGPDRVALAWDGTHLATDDAMPGRTRVWPRMTDWFAPPRDVDLVAGGDTLVTLDVVPGRMRRMRVTMPLPDRWERCQLTVKDLHGAMLDTVTVTTATVGITPAQWQPVLPLQLLVLEADLHGRRQSWPLDCRDPATAATTLRFSLR